MMPLIFVKYLLGFVCFSTISCGINKPFGFAESESVLQERQFFLSDSVEIIQGEFFFEYSIISYVDHDAIVQEGALIQGEDLNISNYEMGVFQFANSSLIEYLNKNNPNLLEEVNFRKTLDFQIQLVFDLQQYPSYDLFYGCTYFRISQNFKVLYGGTQFRRLPHFAKSEKEFQQFCSKNLGLNYRYLEVPVYYIIDVL